MEEKYVDVKGIRTRYLEAGAGEPLLLTHGAQFGQIGADCWELVIDSFGDTFHVFAIDRIGQGFTDNPKSDAEYVMGTVVQHVYDFLNTLKIDSAHVVGHSRGAYVACRLALEHPEVVKTLVVLDSVTLVGANHQVSNHDMKTEKQVALIEDARKRYRSSLAAFYFKSEHITDNLVDQMIKVAELPKTREARAKMGSNPHAGLYRQYQEDLEAGQKETIEWVKNGGIKAPTLIVWGFNDPATKFDPVGLDAIRLILPSTPRSQVHILNQAGHFCYSEQPEAFVAAVTSFIKLNSGL